MALDILVVDDEADIRTLIAGILEDEGYQARLAGDSDSALAQLAERKPSLLVLDIWLHGSPMDGLELLDLVKERYPTLPVIVISGHGNIETAVAAIKRGAYDFFEKPFRADQLLLIVRRATEAERLRRENEELRERAGLDLDLTGVSQAINNTRLALRKIAGTNSRVLITGPAGSGKEVAARLLHSWSGRNDAPFVVVSSASMEPDGVEVELFGQERDGAVTKTGLLEQAHGGTLFLDEVADMPITTQAKILRVLTDQAFHRVGGVRTVKVDVRVVSASSRDLKAEITEGRFREDLYYRLNVVPIRMPALVERREDIPELAEFMLGRLALSRGRRVPRLAGEALAVLQAYDWPGNVRQLRNVLERTLILAPNEETSEIDVDMLPAELTVEPTRMLVGEAAQAVMSAPLREAREAFEREYLRTQIRRFSGNISKTAAFIGMERSALHRKLKLLGLSYALRGTDTDLG
jgi:two-component system, NtrC family, nitrogen regulation response regulator NtrX